MKRKFTAAAIAAMALSMSVPAFAHQVIINVPTTPAVETPATPEVPAEEVPAEEVPAEEVPAEEVPAEEVPAEEVPAEEVPAEEVPAEEVPAEEVPAVEVPAEEVPAEEVPAEETKHSFTDVSAEDEALVNEALSKGIISGVTETTLGADDKMTTQDMCLVLWKMAGSPDVNGITAYNAFKADKYAVSAVKWAVATGVITGADDLTKELTVTDTKAMLYSAGYNTAAITDAEDTVTKIDVLKLAVKNEKRATSPAGTTVMADPKR